MVGCIRWSHLTGSCGRGDPAAAGIGGDRKVCLEGSIVDRAGQGRRRCINTSSTLTITACPS